MPSQRHELLLMLFENRPALAVELLDRSVPGTLPDHASLRVESNELSQLLPTEYWADRVITLLEGAEPVFGVIVEVQLRRDPRKRFAWPVYSAVLRARLECPTCTLVVTPYRGVARWARQTIDLGPPGSMFTPIVAGPDEVPIVTDVDLARHDPELALLSVQVHGRGPRGLDVALAALRGVDEAESLPDDRAMLYCDLVGAAVSRAVRQQLEELMEQGYQFQSDFAKKYLAKGEAKGRAEGRVAALLRFLEARGLSLSPEQRAVVESTTELDLLDTWIARAASATTAHDLLAD